MKEAMEEDPDIELTAEERALLQEVQDTKAIIIQESRLKNTLNSASLPRKHLATKGTVSDFETHLNEMGIDPTLAAERARSQSRGRSTRRSVPEDSVSVGKKRKREDYSVSPGEGLKDAKVSLFSFYYLLSLQY